MTDLDLLLAVAGVLVTVMVVAGMVLITPRGQVEGVPEARLDSDDETYPRRRPHPAGAADTLPVKESTIDGALTTPSP